MHAPPANTPGSGSKTRPAPTPYHNGMVVQLENFDTICVKINVQVIDLR